MNATRQAVLSLFIAFSMVTSLATSLVTYLAGQALADEQETATELVALDVYKSPSCGCCGVWIDHLEERGFKATIHHPQDLNAVKSKYALPNRFQSCHTAVSKDGYVFEGHIPAKIISQFLAEPPEDAVGLTVPAMPVGSPGMESGDRFMPYDVLLLKENGDVEVFARVETREEQY